MHGIILGELKKFIDTKHGVMYWPDLLQECGLGNKSYYAINDYPDEEVVAIVTTEAKKTGVGLATLLEDIGVFIGPGMIKSYAGLINPAWRTLELLEHTENTMHRTVTKLHGAHPPKLAVTRVTSHEAIINYTSPRKMCALATGLVKAYANHYGELIEVTHLSCMHKGDKACNMLVKLI